ncbi:T9SS type A sorting domain-containing protein [Paraflavitalea speifideaquila]|uniref:T9SS type A sorting domain-containing protein n=1 Tax=Paraflavitalea speifideaquila TaxID=3076558 RepID=UPI0028F0E816|nr:T9SS type A sorting domain-containing protein [Paraflavitalea speifideiaquila]
MFNTLGQLVYRKEIDLNGNDEVRDIPMQRLAKGVYYLKLKGEKTIDIVQKILR